MGRRIPTDHNNLLFIHPLLNFSSVAATWAASIVIIAALCGVRSRKKSLSSPSPSDHHLHKTNDLVAGLLQTDESENQNGETQSNELPLPPAMQQQSKESGSMEKSSSERRSSFSLSLKKVHISLSMAKISEKAKPEESVWRKTIILGEKCVPDEEVNAVIYEGKGKKISAYHPRNSSGSFSAISKQLSSITHLDIHPPDDPNTQKQQTNQNDF